MSLCLAILLWKEAEPPDGRYPGRAWERAEPPDGRYPGRAWERAEPPDGRSSGRAWEREKRENEDFLANNSEIVATLNVYPSFCYPLPW
ncbi:MAG: hypothetical protein QNJ63_26185 [Calothrix sp. MO_192.B10]|nr:hypothetical protein [Calothrix sp. MO_192.B10]